MVVSCTPDDETYKKALGTPSDTEIWYTTNDSNEAKNKKYYKAIDPSDLIPKEVDYDFL